MNLILHLRQLSYLQIKALLPCTTKGFLFSSCENKLHSFLLNCLLVSYLSSFIFVSIWVEFKTCFFSGLDFQTCFLVCRALSPFVFKKQVVIWELLFSSLNCYFHPHVFPQKLFQKYPFDGNIILLFKLYNEIILSLLHFFHIL